MARGSLNNNDVRIVVTTLDGTVLDSWERELPDIESWSPDLGPRIARAAICDLADDINAGME